MARNNVGYLKQDVPWEKSASELDAIERLRKNKPALGETLQTECSSLAVRLRQMADLLDASKLRRDAMADKLRDVQGAALRLENKLRGK